MCDICNGLCDTVKIEHPYEYYNLVNQIKQFIQNGVIIIIESNCDFFGIEKGKPFPNDVPYHLFECTNCKQKFSLCVETYHGGGGSWSVEI